MLNHNHGRNLGVVLAAVAAACYAVLWLGFAFHWQWLVTADSAVLDPLKAYDVKHPAWVRFWDVLCSVLSPEGFRLAGAAMVVVAVLRRNLRATLFLLTAIGLSGIVSQIAKDLADRPRPLGATAASSAFPSGHALAAMAAVLALLTISAGVFSHRARIVTIVVGAVMVIAVGVGRVVLNVHYPSDVVAGWALGYLWYLSCLFVIRPPPLSAAQDRTREVPDTAR